jgi:hypothetical protein
VEAPVQLVHSEPGHLVGVVDHVMIEWMPDRPTLAQIDAGTACLRALVKSGAKNGLVIIADGPGSNAVPTEEVRDAFQRRLRAHGSQLAGVAVAVLFGGFSGAAVRGLTTSIALFVRVVPMKVFSSVTEAGAWIAARLAAEGVPTGAARVDAALAEVLAKGRAGMKTR